MGISADSWVLVGALFVAMFWSGASAWSRTKKITQAISNLEGGVAGHLHGIAHTSVRTETAMTDIQSIVTTWRKDLDRLRIGDRLYTIEDLLKDRDD